MENNLTAPERVISSVAGGALAAMGIAKRDWAGLAMAIGGGALLFRGATGYCPVTSRIRSIEGIKGEMNRGGMFRLDSTVTVSKSPEEVYRFWREPKNLPDFFSLAKAEIVNERPGQFIEWKSDSSHGMVRFKRKKGERGTKIHLNFEYRPMLGAAGEAMARWFGKDAERNVTESLTHLKEVLEAA